MYRYKRYFQKQTPEKRQMASMAARARKAKAKIIIPFTKREIVNRDGLRCYLCGEMQTFESATVDHIIPLSRGGYHCASNAKIACLPCNQRKGARVWL